MNEPFSLHLPRRKFLQHLSLGAAAACAGGPPLLASEASRTMTIATAQAQKVDHMVSDLTRRVDETAAILQQAVITPAREGIAIVAAIR